MIAHILAVSPRQMTPTDWGTAQNLTLGILMGVTIFMAILILFWMRSGHERAHRSNVLRAVHNEQTRWKRSEELEAQEPAPQPGERVPR